MSETELIHRISTVLTGSAAVIALSLVKEVTAELTAELKELREFVGAMDKVTATDWYGQWAYLVTGDKYRIYDNADNLLATGTDPFDAWRKMNAGEDE